MLLGRVPADTPVQVAGQTRMDPELDEGTIGSRTVMAATVIDLNTHETVDSPDGHTQRHRVVRAVPAVLLGSYVVAEGKQVPQDTMAYEQWERGINALHDGDAVTVLDSYKTLVRDVAQILTGETDYTLHEEITDNDLREQLHLEGERLMQTALRIAALRDRVDAHLAVR